MPKLFTQAQLEAIADALGDTSDGLTGSEIGHLLATSRMGDIDPSLTKRKRLYNAFASEQNQRQNRTHILGFIRHAMKPERFARAPERFEPMRAHLNRALAFAGLAVNASGTLESIYRPPGWPAAAREAKTIFLISRPAAPPTPRAYRPTLTPTGITRSR